MTFQVTATNRMGGHVVEVFESGEEADVRHRQLFNEVNDKGLFKWGTVRTTNLGYAKTGGLLADTQTRYTNI